MAHQAHKSNTGGKIKSLRLAQSLTQEDLAIKANIAPKYLSLIETNQREASLHVYRCIAIALHIPMWQLFCDLSEESLLAIEDLNDCSEMEIRTLRRFFIGNKHALRQHHSLDFGSNK